MSVKHSTTVTDFVDLVNAAKWNADHVLTGQLALGLMPRGTDGHVLTGTGAGTNPAYEAVEGISDLSELTIDVDKDWNAKRITNLGVPTTTGDAYRRGSSLQLSDIPTMDDGHIPNLEGLSYGGAFATAQIPGLPTTKITSGQFTMGRLPRAASGQFLEGGGVSADPVWNALIEGNIPDLPASKITTGAFDVARIPGLPTTKITSGQFTMGRLPQAASGQFMEGGGVGNSPIWNALVATNIPSLPASKITSEQFALARMPRGTDGYLLTGTGAGSNPAYETPTLPGYTSKPTPGVAYLRKPIVVRSGSGIKSKVYVCVLNDANAYEWVQIGIST